MQHSKLIALSGGSGSGKTVVAMLLKKHFGEDATVISQDSYYKDLSHLPDSERAGTNFDHPDSIDFELLLNNIQILKSGLSVEGPEYCFKTHTRKSTKISLLPKSIVILEGIYSFFDTEIKNLLDFTVYVEADSDIRLIRRIRRDVVERGRDVDSVISQYESNVRNMHLEYVSQQKQSADFVIKNNGNMELDDLVNTLVNEIKINDY
jgi:uridine kinase